MTALRIAIDLAFAALFAAIAWNLVSHYRKARGTPWQRLLCAGRDSATILWGKFCILLSGLVANLDGLADYAGAPELRAFIDAALGNPKAVASVMLALSLVTIAARRRTL